MPRFSRTSQARLDTAHPALQTIFEVVVLRFDCSILEGHRDRERQDLMVARGLSKLPWPRSKHNASPSLAVDAIHYPHDWQALNRYSRGGNDRLARAEWERFCTFAGYVIGTAHSLGHELRWGGDWDRDWDRSDQRFDDLPHFELVELPRRWGREA